MDLTAFQTTIQGLVKTATGFDNGHVIWANQTRPRPSRPFVELSILDDETTTFTEDTTADNPDSDGDDGEEILITTKEHVELNIRAVVFTADVVGTNVAANVARKIRRFFARESTTYALGDIALVSRDAVRDASLVLETEHEGRGILGLKFRVADQDTETTTYIETATVETTIAQTDGAPVVRTLTITQEEE